MNRGTGHYFDARTLAAVPVDFWCEDGHLFIQRAADVEPQRWPLAAVRASDRLGDVPRFLYLPGEASIESPDHGAIDAFLGTRRLGRFAALIHWLEQRSRVAVVATVMLVVAATAFVHVGLPVFARAAAARVPEDIRRQADETALRSFDQFLQPSNLTRAERRHVSDRSAALARELGLPQPRIEFRAMDKHANAFALPGGTIIVTDALARLANTAELEAVLLHEFAHWQLRHGLQSILRGSMALLVVSVVTGDLSTLTALAATIPLTLLQRGYSREFEAEADDYALDALRRTGRDPRHLAAILAKLQSRHAGGPHDFSYLSTHPSTEDRIRRADPAGTVTQIPRPEEAFFLAAMDERPVAVHEPGPPARTGSDSSGVVALEFIITADGTTADVTVTRSLDTESDEAARGAVATWRYRPGRKDGAAAATRATATVTFRPGRRPKVSSDITQLAGQSGPPSSASAATGRDEPPSPIQTRAPAYPEHLRHALVEGKVSLEYTVDAHGRVADVRVLGSSHPDFEAPARDAVLSWRFTPGRKNGRIVATRVQQEVAFHLEPEQAPVKGDPEASVADLLRGLQTPKPLSIAAPVTPFALGNEKGDVRVQFFVTVDGQVVDATVLSSTHAILDAPALAAVKRWRFSPQPHVTDPRVRREMRWVVHFGRDAGHPVATPLEP
jgi:TonB family protein